MKTRRHPARCRFFQMQTMLKKMGKMSKLMGKMGGMMPALPAAFRFHHCGQSFR